MYCIKVEISEDEKKQIEEAVSELEEVIKGDDKEAKKNERTNALREVKRLCKEFGFTAGMLKGSLAEVRNQINERHYHCRKT